MAVNLRCFLPRISEFFVKKTAKSFTFSSFPRKTGKNALISAEVRFFSTSGGSRRSKRFYNRASAGEEVGKSGFFNVELDGRPLKGLNNEILSIPLHELAVLAAAEWSSQGEFIAPESMPINGILRFASIHGDFNVSSSNSSLKTKKDGKKVASLVLHQKEKIINELIEYLQFDTAVHDLGEEKTSKSLFRRVEFSVCEDEAGKSLDGGIYAANPPHKKHESLLDEDDDLRQRAASKQISSYDANELNIFIRDIFAEKYGIHISIPASNRDFLIKDRSSFTHTDSVGDATSIAHTTSMADMPVTRTTSLDDAPPIAHTPPMANTPLIHTPPATPTPLSHTSPMAKPPPTHPPHAQSTPLVGEKLQPTNQAPPNHTDSFLSAVIQSSSTIEKVRELLCVKMKASDLVALKICNANLKSILLSIIYLEGYISAEFAYFIANFEEVGQRQRWGVVEGVHDVEKKTILMWINACKLFRDLLHRGKG